MNPKPNPSNAVSGKIIEEAIAGVLKEAGFKKKGTTWYLNAHECICVVNLQKSQWGEQYYVNLGVSLKRLAPASSPNESQCHIRERLSEIVPNKSQCEKTLNLEESFPTQQRIAIITGMLREHALPFLLSLESSDGIRKALRSGRLRLAVVTLSAKKFLKLPLD